MDGSLTGGDAYEFFVGNNLTKQKGKILSIYQAIYLMIAFATLIILLNDKNKK